MRNLYKIIVALILLIIAGYFIFRTAISNHYTDKGIELYDSAQYPGAAMQLQRAVFWDKKNYTAHIFLIKSYLANNNPEEAGTALTGLKEYYPETAETYALEGRVFITKKEYVHAIEALTQAVTSDSLLSYAYFYRGIAYANVGNLEAAARDYNQAQQLNKSDTDALQRGAMIFGQLNNFKAAIENYDKIIALDSTNAQAYKERSSFKLNIGDFDGALTDINTALQLAPEMFDLFYERGKIWANLENYEKAIADFNTSIAHKFNIAGSNFNIGLANIKLKQLAQARNYLNSCIKTDTDNIHTAKALHLIGVTFMMDNKNLESIEYFNKAINTDKSFADAFYNRGIAHGIMENYEEAINDLHQSMKLGKVSADIFFALGVYQISLHNTQTGCTNLQKAVDMGHEQARAMQQKYCKQFMK